MDEPALRACRPHAGRGRLERLEHSLLVLHASMAVLAPRVVVIVAELTVAVDLLARGERLVHLVLPGFALACVPLMQAQPISGEVSTGLAFPRASARGAARSRCGPASPPAQSIDGSVLQQNYRGQQYVTLDKNQSKSYLLGYLRPKTHA